VKASAALKALTLSAPRLFRPAPTIWRWPLLRLHRFPAPFCAALV